MSRLEADGLVEVTGRTNLNKLNLNKFVKTKNRREEVNNLKEIRGRIVEKGLPPLRNRNVVKSYDYGITFI